LQTNYHDGHNIGTVLFATLVIQTKKHKIKILNKSLVYNTQKLLKNMAINKHYLLKILFIKFLVLRDLRLNIINKTQNLYYKLIIKP
jgi:hypothetical protein